MDTNASTQRVANERIVAPQLYARVDAWVKRVLPIQDEMTLLIREMNCTTLNCPPVRTDIFLLCPERMTVRYKIHKAMEDITFTDVEQLGTIQPKILQEPVS